MKIQLLNDRFTFKELKNDENKYMLTYSLHLQKAPITASSENLPDSRCSAHGRKYYFLSNKTFQVLIFENIHITKSYIIKFLVNIWNHGNNLRDLTVLFFPPAGPQDCKGFCILCPSQITYVNKHFKG